MSYFWTLTTMEISIGLNMERNSRFHTRFPQALNNPEAEDIWDIDSEHSIQLLDIQPDSKVHGANMGPTWVLSASDGPNVGPMKLAIRARFFRLGMGDGSNITVDYHIASVPSTPCHRQNPLLLGDNEQNPGPLSGEDILACLCAQASDTTNSRFSKAIWIKHIYSAAD